jgi:hypothetical protein
MLSLYSQFASAECTVHCRLRRTLSKDQAAKVVQLMEVKTCNKKLAAPPGLLCQANEVTVLSRTFLHTDALLHSLISPL